MDGTEDTQDITSGEEQETSENKPESFTEEQVVERERKAKSDVSADLGRVTKLNADLIKSSQAIQDRLERRDKEEDEREREKYRDEPDKLSAIDERIKRREVESKLAQKEQELDIEKAKTSEAEGISANVTKERNAREIATRLGVNAETLIKFTDGSTAAMEELAKALPKKGDAVTLTPDSGKTITGGEKSDEQKLKERYKTMF